MRGMGTPRIGVNLTIRISKVFKQLKCGCGGIVRYLYGSWWQCDQCDKWFDRSVDYE